MATDQSVSDKFIHMFADCFIQQILLNSLLCWWVCSVTINVELEIQDFYKSSVLEVLGEIEIPWN